MLTWKQLYWAAQVGVRRNIEAMARGLQHVPALLDDLDEWVNHIEGAGAELAFAVWRGVVWKATVNTFRSGFDVDRHQVRWAREDHYRLILRDTDNPAHVFVLVVGRSPEYTIVGWLRAVDGMKSEFLQDYGRGSAYFVPRHLMNPLDTLPDE